MDEWINALERVIHHQAALGDYVMPATCRAAEQLHQVVSLANDIRISVGSMIGHQHQYRIFRDRRFLDRGPDAADSCVNFANGGKLGFAVAIVMRPVINVGRVVIEITDPRVR